MIENEVGFYRSPIGCFENIEDLICEIDLKIIKGFYIFTISSELKSNLNYIQLFEYLTEIV